MSEKTNLLQAAAVGSLAGAAFGIAVASWLTPSKCSEKPALSLEEIKAFEKPNSILLKALSAAPIVPVITIRDSSGAAALVTALLEAGLSVIEVSFATAAAEETVLRMSHMQPDVVIGASSILNVAMAQRAMRAGARYISTPASNADVICWCRGQCMCVIPGVATATDIEGNLQLGCTLMRFFHAESRGGANSLKALCAAYPQVTFLPHGGIRESNLERYHSLPGVVCCCASWMVPQDVISQSDWRRIKELALKAHVFARSKAKKKVP